MNLTEIKEWCDILQFEFDLNLICCLVKGSWAPAKVTLIIVSIN